MTLKQTLSMFALLLCIQSSHATQTKATPSDLLYANQPIDSLCFFNMEKNADNIDLSHCGAASSHYTMNSRNTELTNQGFIGYDWQDPRVSNGITGYSYYRYFPAANNTFWIYSVNSSGGSGEFTTIYLMKRIDNTHISLKAIAGGDRCNGGLSDVSAQNGTLSYHLYLTAYDLIKLSNQPADNISAYDDLAACAACCVAEAIYSLQANEQPKLLRIELDKTMDLAELPEQGNYQPCFNKLFVSYRQKNPNNLDQTSLTQFANDFNQQCVQANNVASIPTPDQLKN